jgi:hypothetical protein
MLRLQLMKSLQKFASVHVNVDNRVRFICPSCS